MSKAFGFTSLTGGGSGALDAIDGSILADGDLAFGAISGNTAYTYRLNASSGASESSPDVISPDSNAGTKRWILANVDLDASYISFTQDGTDAIERTVQEKCRDLLDARDFGVTADGTTDEILLLQSVVDYVESLDDDSRPLILLPPGIIRITDALVITKDGIRIRGAGCGRSTAGGSAGTFKGGTALFYDGVALPSIPTEEPGTIVKSGVITMGYFGMLTSLRYVQIEDLAIYCQELGVGIYAAERWNTGSSLKDIYISRPTVGVYVQDHGYSTEINKVEIHGYTTHGIVLADNCHSTSILRCGFVYSSNDETPSSAVHIGSVGDSSNVTISRCNFDAKLITDHVVVVKEACKNFNFINNYIEIYDTDTAGCMSIEEAVGVTVIGNRFSTQTGGAAYGIELGADVLGAVVMGNYFSGFDSACVQIATGAQRVAVFGNGLVSCGAEVEDNSTANSRKHILRYQEDTFTPGLTFGDAAVGMTGDFNGQYTLIGDICVFQLRIALTAKGSSTGNAAITGLPFQSNNLIQMPLEIQTTGNMGTLTGVLTASVSTSATSFSIYQTSATGRTALTHADFTDTSQINVAGQYKIGATS